MAPDVSARSRKTVSKQQLFQKSETDKKDKITDLENEISKLKKTIHQSLTETKVNEINVQNIINKNAAGLKTEIDGYKKRLFGLEQQVKQKDSQLADLQDEISRKVWT